MYISQLDGKTIKLSGFTETLKVRAAEAKVDFPSRHDWDSYFRDAKHMDETRFGERPDTIHIRDLPCRWFANRKEKERDVPSEFIVRKVFETFGDVRCVDIPMLDPYRKEMTVPKSSIQTFSFGQDIVFEAFVQFCEYIGFVKAMSSLRGMKLLYKGEDGKALTANIKVDFDRTKHLSEKSIRKRRIEREKLIQLEREREERVRREREEEERKRDEERRRIEAEELDREKKREEKVQRREERRIEREERRRQQKLELKRQEEERQMQLRIAIEERKILIAQRKLETIRLLSELFTRIKAVKAQEEMERHERELEAERRRKVEREKQQRLDEERRRLEAEHRKREELEQQEQELRKKILQKMKVVEEKREERQREELRRKLAGGMVKLKSAVAMKK
jgi:arginine/serine-rich splicing factor 17